MLKICAFGEIYSEEKENMKPLLLTASVFMAYPCWVLSFFRPCQHTLPTGKSLVSRKISPINVWVVRQLNSIKAVLAELIDYISPGEVQLVL